MRIGVMGYFSQRKEDMLVLVALKDCLSRYGFQVPVGESVSAALRVHERAEGATAGLAAVR